MPCSAPRKFVILENRFSIMMINVNEFRMPFPKGWRCRSRRLRSGVPRAPHRSGSKVVGEGKISGDMEMKRFDIPMAVYQVIISKLVWRMDLQLTPGGIVHCPY
jgi:hypothetical protein